MKLRFLDRADERRRLARALKAKGGALAVVYGRRRCGKSTLIQRALGRRGIYYLADQKQPALQIMDLAAEVDRVLPGFSSAAYPTWDALLRSLDRQLGGRTALCIDEAPYLVQLSPELPSVLQKYLDLPGAKRLNVVLCGSSQRMIHGLVLDKSAPLHGRALEILRIEPLKAGWIRQGLGLKGAGAVEAFSVWGGVPRYWELAAQFKTLEEGIRELVMDRNGVLHDEPMRLLIDDMRSAVQPFSLLCVIGQGCHRISEIAGRLGKPATGLMRPLAQLVDLGYVRRETPFGADEKSTKRSLYKVGDPFLAFYFSFLQPNRSMLEGRPAASLMAEVLARLPLHVSHVWEDLARASVPACRIGGRDWGEARRWWGPGLDGTPLELDAVAESRDGDAVLLGEAKWGAAGLPSPGVRDRLLAKARNLPFLRGRQVVPVLWAGRPGKAVPGLNILSPDAVLDGLR